MPTRSSIILVFGRIRLEHELNLAVDVHIAAMQGSGLVQVRGFVTHDPAGVHGYLLDRQGFGEHFELTIKGATLIGEDTQLAVYRGTLSAHSLVLTAHFTQDLLTGGFHWQQAPLLAANG